MQHKKFSSEEISALCTGLAHLLHAGLYTGDALTLLAQDEKEEHTRQLLQTMAMQADEGSPLGTVLKDAQCFPAYVCTLVAAGEETGRTEEALFALGDYYENRAQLNRQVRGALLSPLLLMGILLVVVFVLLVWVLPVFDDVYRQLGSSLTGIAGGLLALGSLLRRGIPVILGLLLAVGTFLVWLFVSAGAREKVLAALRSRWGDRGVFAQINAARLAQVLAMAMRSGLDAESALLLAADLAEGDERFAWRCQDCLDKLRDQAMLPQALRESGLMEAADCRLLEAGIRGGCGDTVMTKLAQRIQERSEAQLEGLLGRMEPALVLTASVLVGAILLCVLLPLTRIMAAIG